MSNLNALAREIRALDVPEDQIRQVRAIFAAQLFSHTVDLSRVESTNVGVYVEAFRKEVVKLNELVVVDIKLAETHFSKLLQERIAMIRSVSNTTLSAYILERRAADEGEASQVEATAILNMMSSPNYAKALRSLLPMASMDTDA